MKITLYHNKVLTFQTKQHGKHLCQLHIPEPALQGTFSTYFQVHFLLLLCEQREDWWEGGGERLDLGVTWAGLGGDRTTTS